MQEAGEAVSSLIGSGTVEKSQACFLPQSQDGVPVIGKVPNVEGAYIASGGLCFGQLKSEVTERGVKWLTKPHMCKAAAHRSQALDWPGTSVCQSIHMHTWVAHLGSTVVTGMRCSCSLLGCSLPHAPAVLEPNHLAGSSVASDLTAVCICRSYLLGHFEWALHWLCHG